MTGLNSIGSMAASVTRLAALIPVILAVYACDRSQTPSGAELEPAVESVAETASEAPRGNLMPRWESGLPDPRPRGEVRRGDVSVPPDPDYVQAMGTEIWCVPGCRLNNDDEGLPIVPQWCTAWSELTPTYFVRESDEDELNDDTSVVAYFSNSSDKRDASVTLESKNQSRIACTRIDLSRITKNASSGLYGSITELPISRVITDREITSFNGQTVGMNCMPGCVIPWSHYGFLSDRPRQEENKTFSLPNWCSAGSNGYRERSVQAPGRKPINTRILNAKCTRIKFSDTNYGGANVE